MSDLRGISRGSKAATIVVLVVLLQVIVLAFLGLGAIQSDRDEGMRVAAQERDRKANLAAADTLKRAWEGLQNAMVTAVRAAREEPGGFRNVTREGWNRTFAHVYLVDRRGQVSTSERVRLHVPPEVIAEEEARAGPGYAERITQTLGAVGLSAEERRRYVREFPWRTESNRWATAVGEALKLAEEAIRAAAQDAARPPSAESIAAVTDAVVLAFETAALNADRAAAERPGLAYVVSRLEHELGRLPAELSEQPRHALAALRSARDGLDGFLEYVLATAKDAAARPTPPRVFQVGGGTLVALDSLPGGGEPEAMLIRLDRTLFQLRVEDEVVAAGTKGEGLSVRLYPRGMRVVDPSILVQLPFQAPYFEPGFDVVVSRAEAGPPAPATGPRETFYWSILGASTLGLATAGVVLFRILRREVHLARLKTDFVSNLSHELKTPLTSIAMFVEMYRDGQMREGPELREAMDVIAQEAERLQRIVMRMIEVARRESASTGYDRRPGDLNAPVRAACERFRRLERSPGLSLEVDLAPALPPVLLDASAIDDAVANLLENAWKYREGDRARIRVATRPVRRGVELAVSDDGVGIPRRERRRIFEMFYRADSFLTRPVPGTGLGLALVRTIVRVHRGRIRVEGAPGEGTTFRIRFPAARGARGPAPAPTPAPSAAAPRAPAATGAAPTLPGGPA